MAIDVPVFVAKSFGTEGVGVERYVVFACYVFIVVFVDVSGIGCIYSGSMLDLHYLWLLRASDIFTAVHSNCLLPLRVNRNCFLRPYVDRNGLLLFRNCCPGYGCSICIADGKFWWSASGLGFYNWWCFT